MNAWRYCNAYKTKQLQVGITFKQNVKKNPNNWNVYDSLGEAYEKSGDRKQAIATYKTALAIAPQDQKTRIENTLNKIGK